MGAITAYSISVAIVLAVVYMVYKCLLAKATFYRFNRAVLLLCYLIALVALPISDLIAPLSRAGAGVNIEASIVASIKASETVDSFSWFTIVPIIYFVGLVVMAMITIISYARMTRIIRSGEHWNLGDAVMVIAKSDVAPFSWGKYLVVTTCDADNQLIIEHELIHIRNRHSIDLIFAQLFVIFNWFNPTAYLMRRELSAVHEYDVDMQILNSGVNVSDYQMLLIKKTVGSGVQSIANSLNHSQLKNRLTMMLKSKSKAPRRLCAAALIPAAVLAVAMTDFPAVASTIGSISSVSYGKGSENLSTVQIDTRNFKMLQLTNGDETTLVIEGENLGNDVDVSGSVELKNKKNTYYSKHLECSIVDEKAILTITFPLVTSFDDVTLSFNINGEPIVLDLDPFFTNTSRITMREEDMVIIDRNTNQPIHVFINGVESNGNDLMEIGHNDIVEIMVDKDSQSIYLKTK